MKFNRETLFTELKKKLFTDKFASSRGQGQIKGIELLLDEAEKRDIQIDSLAYILSTVYGETAFTMQPIQEMGSEKYLKSKPYWPYIGRGYVQLTWEKNYKFVSDRYGIDAVNDPDIVMQEPYATSILFDGMLEGWFTGKKLSEFIDNKDEGFVEDEREFEASRTIINGVDKKKVFAENAWEWKRCLNAAWVTNENPLNRSTTVPAGTVGAVAGGMVLIDPIKDLASAVKGQEGAFNSGSTFLMIAAVLIIGAALYTVWARWDAAGRPKFW